MANGYGGSTSTSSSSSSSVQTQAPSGFHYMSDGTLMSDAEHIRLYGESDGFTTKIIQDFIFDTSNIAAGGSSKSFNIQGSIGANFSLEIVTNISGTNKYYNFKTKTLQTTPIKLIDSIKNSSGYTGSVSFPVLSDLAVTQRFDIRLLAEQNTLHTGYVEVRDVYTGEIDINDSKGSNSLMLTKKINQAVDSVLTLTPSTPSSAAGLGSATIVSDTVTVKGGFKTSKAPFTLSVTTANGKALALNNTVNENDFLIGTTQVIGNPVVIGSEDPFDQGQSARSTDTVDGAVSSSNRIVMDTNVATKMVIGDKVTGTGISSSIVLTVVSLNPDSDNAKEFEVSEAVSIDDGVTLTFKEPYYHRWEIPNSYSLFAGIKATGTNVVSDTFLSRYIRSTTASDGITEIIDADIPAVNNTGSIVVSDGDVLRDGILTYSSEGVITFNKPQPLILAGDTVTFSAYGRDAISNYKGWDLEISELKATITKPTTTTTAAVINSTSVPVASGNGIMDDVSTVSSINMASSAVDPTVTTIGSYSGSTATLTLSAAQTLENGETLTFDKAGQLVTITGKIKINQIGSTATLNLDLDRFITSTTET